MSIGQYQYTYGLSDSNTHNRTIKFFNNNGTISAEIWGERKGKWYEIGSLSEKSMTKAALSTTEKAKRMMLTRLQGTSPTIPADQKFTELVLGKKLSIIGTLQPRGSWHITTESAVGNNFETLLSLIFHRSG